jgi:hypothetical protein
MYNLISGRVSLHFTHKLTFSVYCEKVAPSSQFEKRTERYPKRSAGCKKALQWDTSKPDSGFCNGRVVPFPLLFYRYGALRLELASLFVSPFVDQYHRIGPASLPKRLTIVPTRSAYMEHHEANRERIKIYSRAFRGSPRFKTQQW